MAWGSKVAALVLFGACACATPPPRRVAPPPVAAAPPPVRMAVLPVESDAYPKVADALNGVFKTVKVASVDDTLRPPVTLDVVQVQIECLEETEACYLAAGKSLNVNRLLIGRIGRPEKKAKGVRVTVTFFNVDTGLTANTVDRVFRKQDDAVKTIGALVAEVFGPGADAGRAP